MIQKPKIKETKERSAKDEDSYDDENISDASGEVQEGNTCNDDDFEDIDNNFNDDIDDETPQVSESQDEDTLLRELSVMYLSGPSIESTTAQVLSQIGRETLIKIFNATSTEGDSLFSESDQEEIMIFIEQALIK